MELKSLNNKLKILTPLIATSFALVSCSQEKAPDANIDQAEQHVEVSKTVPAFWPVVANPIQADRSTEKRVQEILQSMTIEQKIAQMIQPEIRSITPEDMRKYGFGSYLNGGGSFPNQKKQSSISDWIDFAEQMYLASIDASMDGSTIPTMWGTDAVHGHNNVIGATLFPHNIGLGAANNPRLIEQIAQATATEVMVTGIDWIFAPTVAVVRDDRWGRTYEGYSEDPEIVKAYSAAIVRGLQGQGNQFLGDDKVIATVKHFLGDGGTEKGDDQGNNIASEEALYRVHAQGYIGGLTSGAQTVMASFNSWHGKKNHGSYYLLTQVLKERMGFDGFIVGDWNGHGQVKGCSNESCSQSINAGLDMFMAPTDSWKPLYYNTLAQAKSGEIPMSRIDDAVSRILRVKVRAGLFDKPSPAKRLLSGKTELIGHPDHRAIARQAVRESLVLLKNKNNLLPLPQNRNILIAGDAADNIGKQSGGWTITWQGTGNTNNDFPGATSILDGIKNKLADSDANIEFSPQGNYQTKPDVAIVVFGEEPYAEGNGDLDNLEYQRGNKRDLALLKKLKRDNIPVIAIFISGRPMWVNPELNASDAFVAAWLPGTEGQGIADVIFRKRNGEVDFDFTGKLSFSWPNSPIQTTVNRYDTQYNPLLPYGFGLSYSDINVIADNLDEEIETLHSDLIALNLFNAPWRPAIVSESDVELITSNNFSGASIKYQTIDRDTQEDARRIEFTGDARVMFEIQDNFVFDLRGYADANAALSFDIRRNHVDELPLHLSMRCEQECNPAIDLSNFLKTAERKAWQTVQIALACFSNKGATMDKIIAPFVLSTNKPQIVEIAKLEITTTKSKNVIECR